MGRACGAHGGGKRCIQHFGWEALGVDGRITSRWILGEIGFGDVDWIRLAQYRDRWRALVNTVMNLRVP
jgi:hypothetical protein